MAECGIAADRSSHSAIELCRTWIQDCENAHTSCALTTQAELPRRVIDCRPDRDLKLCRVSNEPAAQRYLALSYCWGGTNPPTTTKANFPQHGQCIRWETLPKLYQEVVVLARKLDIPFLWIDSLCIIQDESKDRNHQIARMGGIFESATLVVIAAASQSPHMGFFTERARAWHRDNRLRFVWREPTLVHYKGVKLDGVKFRERVHAGEFEKDACRREPIGQRAWTYQERQLARRCLIMRGLEMVWECKTACLCECSGDQSSLTPSTRLHKQLLPPRKPDAMAAGRVFESVEDAYKFWHTAVRAFTSRKLSRETDRLPAISALAAFVAKETGSTYLAGLWKDVLLTELMWYSFPSYDEVRPYIEYIAPSWSWASIPVQAYYDEFPPNPCAKVVEARWSTSSNNPRRQKEDTYIVLSAVHCQAYVWIYRAVDHDWPLIGIQMQHGSIHETESNHSECSFLDCSHVEGVSKSGGDTTSHKFLRRIAKPQGFRQSDVSGRVRLLWLAEDICLILAYPVDGSDGYTRLGILDIHQAPSIPALPRSRIKII